MYCIQFPYMEMQESSDLCRSSSLVSINIWRGTYVLMHSIFRFQGPQHVININNIHGIHYYASIQLRTYIQGFYIIHQYGFPC